MIHNNIIRSKIDKKKHLGDKVLSNIIKSVRFTEKAHALSELGKYIFIADVRANKYSVKQAIEFLFGITVIKVNVMNYMKRKVIFKGKIGHQKKYKKVIVTVAPGQEKINFNKIITTEEGKNVSKD